MPTYGWRCTTCSTEKDVFSHGMNPVPPLCCSAPMDRLISTGQFILRGSFPGKDLTRETENNRLTQAARKARDLKDSGVVPREEVLRIEDVGKYDL